MWYLNDLLIVEISQDGQEEPPVPVVRHTATIVTFSSQVSYGLKWNFFIFIYE